MMNNALNKTNVRLTGNIKLVVTDDEWYFESIDSNKFLESYKYKGFVYNKNLEYHTNLRNFINNNQKVNLYDVKSTEDLVYSNELYNQYHDLYNYGCYSEESQLVDENMRFFAPINIDVNDDNYPDLFVILKTQNINATLNDVINEGNVVKVFELDELNKEVFSKIQDCNISTNYKTELSINGFDINTGSYLNIKEYEFEKFIKNESTIIEFDNWLTNSFKRNSLIYTNIVNLEFAFTDEKVDGKFVKYYGYYCKKNELSFNDSNKYSNGLRLIKTEKNYIKFNRNHQTKSYITNEFSSIGNSFGKRSYGVLEFNFNINPKIGNLIQISIDGVVDYTLVLSKSIVDKNINVTKMNIVNEFNNNFLGQKTSIRAEFTNKNRIRLITNTLIDESDNIRLYTNASEIQVINPIKSGDRVFNNEFIFPSENSILSNTYFNSKYFDYLLYNETYNRIRNVYEYFGQYYYELEDDILDNIIPGTTFWFCKQRKDQPYLMSFFDIHELDMNTEVTNYQNLNDFDLVKYKEFLLKIVNSDNYLGNVYEYFNVDENSLTPEQLLEYKNKVKEKIDLYFDSTPQNLEYFIKDIDPIDYEVTNTDSEYNRLLENEIPNLRKYNRLYQFINKWVSSLDSNNNPNRLNVSVAFGEESFCASHFIDRNKNNNTHDWFVLGDGVPEYFTKIDNRSISYSKHPVDDYDFFNTEFDAYEHLKNQSEFQEYENFSTIKWDKLQKSSIVFFKGVKYNLNKNLDGYKFSIILKSKNQVIDKEFDIKTIQNDVFKTFTIFINYYIPDPILTTLERGPEYYFLDKSLLYFSDNLYSTIENSIDFGQSNISLELYNNVEPKTYLGTTITNDWYNVQDGKNMIYVKRGNSGMFNTSFTDLLSIGDDLTIFYTFSDDPNSPWYGMYIYFKDIIEVSKDHFWCRELIVMSNLNSDHGIIDDDIDNNTVDEILTYNVLEEYLNNNNIFYENNTIYISKAIAYERCKYDKIINQRANSARYNNISLSNIKTYLTNNDVKNSDGTTIRLNIFDQSLSEINISNKSIDGEVVKLDIPYSFKIGRQHQRFKPNTKILQSFYDSKEYKKVFNFDEIKYLDFVKIISKVSQEYLDIQNSKLIEIPKLYKESKIYSYVRTANNEIVDINLPWNISPNEIRNYKESIVLNTSEKLEFSITPNSNIIDLTSLLNNYVTNLCSLNELSDDDLFKYISIYTYIEKSSMVVSDVKNTIIEKFIYNLLTKIYRLENIKNDDGRLIEGYINNTSIILDNTYNERLTIKLTR